MNESTVDKFVKWMFEHYSEIVVEFSKQLEEE